MYFVDAASDRQSIGDSPHRHELESPVLDVGIREGEGWKTKEME